MLLPKLLVDTALILTNLRLQMSSSNLDAYIVPYGGSHYDERVADCDARIRFISGFSGSAASIIVSRQVALLWTDGRYFLEAEDTLYNDWTLMKDGEPGTPSQSQWLLSNVTHNTGRVGVAGSTYPKSTFDQMRLTLNGSGIELVDTENLVDKIWVGFPEDPRPDCPLEPVHDLEMKFAGKAVTDKLKDVRELLANEGADYAVISELDEVAWLLNLRGKDMTQASLFFGFIILGRTSLEIFIDSVKISPEINATLVSNYSGTVHQYLEIGKVLGELAEDANKIWLSKYVNAELANMVPQDKQLIKLSPVMLMKSKKNDVEAQGMRDAHLRDSAAIIAFQTWLKQQLDAGVTTITEVSAAQKLFDIRKDGEYFVDQSFTTIAGFGSNGAIIHYRPSAATDKNITKNDVFLLDSGGLYYDGTCDITRTMHFGTPSAEQKDRYTRVLKGHVALAKAVFPVKTTGARLDAFARKPLWEIGLDYKHGTGHGIGHYLNVHEGPQRISGGYSIDDSGLEENMFLSNEPGYYKDGEYGIRIENIIRIAKSAKYADFLEIETVSFVPLHKNLIDVSILTEEEIKWINEYHQQCLEKVGKFIDDHDYIGPEVRAYLEEETAPLMAGGNTCGSTKPITYFSSFTMMLLTAILIFK